MRRERNSDHVVATIARFAVAGAGIVAGLMFIRSVPDIIRYLKIERM
jgi:hypothetical protein